MKIGIHSRFCESCTKDVMDFTGMDRRAILEYLLANYDKQVCGRIYPHQLDFSHQDYMVTIRALEKRTNNSNLAFYLLTLGTLVLAGCNSESPTQLKTQKQDSLQSLVIYPRETLKEIAICPPAEPITDSGDSTILVNGKRLKLVTMIMGNVIVSPPDSTPNFSLPFDLVDRMPEFKGGMDSLTEFIKANLHYPEWERRNKIEGKIYASFTVDEDGKIKDPQIIGSVKGSKNFDSEVLRVISMMPDWIPGSNNGQNVDVRFNLPINFQL